MDVLSFVANHDKIYDAPVLQLSTESHSTRMHKCRFRKSKCIFCMKKIVRRLNFKRNNEENTTMGNTYKDKADNGKKMKMPPKAMKSGGMKNNMKSGAMKSKNSDSNNSKAC